MKRRGLIAMLMAPLTAKPKGLDEFDAAMADCNEGRVVDMETAMTEAPPCDGHELSVNVTIWYGYCPECLKRGENGTSDGKRQGVY